MAENYTPNEMMTIAAARALKNDDVAFVGIGAPSAACNLARLTHAPDIVLIYESGTIETKPNILPLSIGDGELCETALFTVSVPEMFRYWLQGGRVTTGFLGGAQIDKFANLNTTVVGPYNKPAVRLPGGGGAPEIATNCGRIFITMNHSKRTFVDKLDPLRPQRSPVPPELAIFAEHDTRPSSIPSSTSLTGRIPLASSDFGSALT
jgi:glutaconate CoA-transferase subunit B